MVVVHTRAALLRPAFAARFSCISASYALRADGAATSLLLIQFLVALEAHTVLRLQVGARRRHAAGHRLASRSLVVTLPFL